MHLTKLTTQVVSVDFLISSVFKDLCNAVTSSAQWVRAAHALSLTAFFTYEHPSVRLTGAYWLEGIWRGVIRRLQPPAAARRRLSPWPARVCGAGRLLAERVWRARSLLPGARCLVPGQGCSEMRL